MQHLRLTIHLDESGAAVGGAVESYDPVTGDRAGCEVYPGFSSTKTIEAASLLLCAKWRERYGAQLGFAF
jgi:hypothetical protein